MKDLFDADGTQADQCIVVPGRAKDSDFCNQVGGALFFFFFFFSIGSPR